MRLLRQPTITIRLYIVLFACFGSDNTILEPYYLSRAAQRTWPKLAPFGSEVLVEEFKTWSFAWSDGYLQEQNAEDGDNMPEEVYKQWSV